MEPSGAARVLARGRSWVCSWIDPGPTETSPGSARVDGAGTFKPACSRISRSRRRPLPGDFDPARLRGNVDRDETGPQSTSLEKNGFAERQVQSKRTTHITVIRAGPGPLRASPSTRAVSARESADLPVGSSNAALTYQCSLMFEQMFASRLGLCFVARETRSFSEARCTPGESK